ncbi:MAG: ABC transporter substrate-binding protein [Deltaproteobacteria bacterium]|nr:ABC transporter substrate-binding protein [Deltaproteobacteria bacterium]
MANLKMNIGKGKFWVTALLFFTLASAGPQKAQAGAVTEQLRSDVDRIIDILNDGTLKKKERDEKIVSIVRARFDFPTMSQWILGVNWRKASPDEQKRFIELFTRLLERTYMGKIESYTGEYGHENVRYAQERQEKDKALVNTFIVTKSAEIPVNYKLLLNNGQWRVYDVVIEEVSLVRNYRSTYSEIVNREGFKGLFAKMEQKIAEPIQAPKK